MASLKVHYDIIESAEYDLEQATEALNKFMLRAQQQEYNSLFKKYNSIMSAPRAALWKNMPAHIRPPPDAILPRSQGAQPGTSSRMINSTARINNSVPTSFGQNFQGPMRRDWQPSWGEGTGVMTGVAEEEARAGYRNTILPTRRIQSTLCAR